jgi:hypothetical protein
VCCRLSGHHLQQGVIEPLCASDGAGIRLRFGLGQLACGAESTISMHIDLPGDELMAGRERFIGLQAQVCYGDDCAVTAHAELGLYPLGTFELNGFFLAVMPGGEAIEAGFTAESCPDHPVECE